MNRNFGRVLCASLMLLAACGGGGGGSNDIGHEVPAGPVFTPPPVTPADLSATTAELEAGMRSATINAGAVFAQQVLLPSGFVPFGNPFDTAVAASREQPQALATFTCERMLPAPCTGSLSIDANYDPQAAVIAAGSHVTFGFDGLAGTTADGVAFALNGAQRVDYLTDYAGSLPGMRFDVTTIGMSGSIGGRAFDPDDSVMRVAFDAQGDAALTIGGRAFSGLSGLSATDADNFVLGTARIRSSHWSVTGRYVDHDYENWQVVAGRPAVGSRVTLSAGTEQLVAEVIDSTTAHVVFDVQATVDGATQQFTVTVQ